MGDGRAHLSNRHDSAGKRQIARADVSQNLPVLCDAGLLSRRKAGHFRLYQTNHDAVGPPEPFLAPCGPLTSISFGRSWRDQRERAP